jgi:hypothetical protein
MTKKNNILNAKKAYFVDHSINKSVKAFPVNKTSLTLIRTLRGK